MTLSRGTKSIVSLTAFAAFTGAAIAPTLAGDGGQVEKDAWARYSSKYEIESIDVFTEYTGQGARVDGYQVWIKVVECKGAVELYYDDAGILKTERDKVKCP